MTADLDSAIGAVLFRECADAVLLYAVPTLHLLRANPAAGRLFGRPPEQLVGLRLPDLFLPADLALVETILRDGATANGEAAVELALAGPPAQPVRVRQVAPGVVLLHPIGPVAPTGSPPQGAGDRFAAWPSRSVFMGVWDWDVASNVLTWDDAMFPLYGVARESFRGCYDDWRRTVHPDDLARTEAELRAALQGVGPFDTQFRIILSDGTVRYLTGSATVLRDESGRPVRVVGVNIDVTAHVRGEVALRETRDQLRSILAAIDDVIYSTSADGATLLFLSQAAEAVYGLPLVELLEHPDRRLAGVVAEDRPRLEAVERAVAEQGAAAAEYRVRRPDGTVVWVSDRVRLVRDDHGRPLRRDGVVTDITNLKSAEDAPQPRGHPARLQRRAAAADAGGRAARRGRPGAVLPVHRGGRPRAGSAADERLAIRHRPDAHPLPGPVRRDDRRTPPGRNWPPACVRPISPPCTATR
ncbi:MAG: PAS domain-containing protein [Gemmataceae bacterium]